MKITASSFSDCGPHRKENEDFVYCNTDERIFIVADGLGGLPEGKYASSEATRIFAREFYPAVDTSNNVRSRLESALHKTNETLLAEARARNIRFGTTLTATHVWNNSADFIHVGDTALWLLDMRDNSTHVLTRQDTLEREFITRGDPPVLASQYRNKLTQAVGLTRPITPQVGHTEVHTSDILILCSDGFSGYVEPCELLNLARAAPNVRALAQQARKIVGDRSPRDNFSAIFLKIE